MSFKDIIRLIQDGESVNSKVTNRPLRDLNENDAYLLSLIEAIDAGAAVYRKNVLVEETVVIGSPVYFNADTGTFEKGLAAAQIIDGVITVSPKARLWGICSYKHSSTRADILLHGYAELDISAAVTGTVTAGAVYYLSGQTAGTLVLSEPPVGIPVLHTDAAGGVFVNIRLSDLFAEHQHYKFDLLCEPCGIPVVDAGTVTIDDADSSLVGWLPADDAIFEGRAPAGAIFGYNISASSLANAWPPLPLAGATVEWFNGTALSIPELEGLLVIDINGIWWMTDCENYVPWPADFIFGGTTIAYDPTDCPPQPPMTMRLWYSRPKFHTSGTAVTSLQPKENSIITIRCLNNDTADQTTGDLEIDVDFQLLLETATDTAGYTVLKGISADKKFTRGPVVSGIKSGNGSLIVTGSATVGDYAVGNVLLTVLPTAVGSELDVQSVRLFGATEENYNGTLGLGFPVDRQTSYLGELRTPYDLDVTTISVALRFWVLARAAGTLPALTLTAQIVERPDPVDEAAALIVNSTTLDLTWPVASVAEDEYIEVTSEAIDVAPGTQILFTLERDDSGGDGFPGELHIIRQSGVITGVA